jgi:O-antigen/teichoic acid export membrane protein
VTDAPAAHRTGSQRIFANLGLLLSGKAGAGVMSLGYLIIAARTLGADDYGVLILVHAYVSLLGGIVAFSGWHGLVRYGSAALQAGEHGRLLRIARFMTLVEIGFGLLAMLIAAALVPLVGPHMGWPPNAMRFAVPYTLAILATVRSTPQGILQLAGRFDLIGAHQLVSPGVRLIGCLIVWWTGGGLLSFLLVWLLAALSEWAAMWILGLWVLRSMRLSEPLIGGIAGTLSENAGLLRFIATTNVDLTLGELAPKLSPLTVGWMLGPASAGLYALAQRASVVLQQPALMLGQASYAVMAKLLAEHDFAGFRRSVWVSTATAILIALPIAVLIGIFASEILHLLGGKSFGEGATLLVLLAIARGLALGSPALSSALIALGFPSRSIAVNLTTNLVLYPLLPAMVLMFGLDGAGWNALLQSVVATVALALFVSSSLRRQHGARRE